MPFRKNIFLLFAVSFLLNCNTKTYTLQNGRTKVPVDSVLFNNKLKFTKDLLSIIDTSVVYEQCDGNSRTLFRLDIDKTHRFYGVYRFYSNGNLNYFTIDREKQLDSNSFNPNYQGDRGIYYMDKGKIKIDLFTRMSGSGNMGNLTWTLTVSNDTLYEHTKYVKYVEVYVKRKIPQIYLNYSANW